MTSIEREDILPGDTIKATTDAHGVTQERSGKVAYQNADGIRTDEHGYIWFSGWADKWVFDLIDRPKPALPTETSSIIIATRVRGVDGCWPMFLRKHSEHHLSWWAVEGINGFMGHDPEDIEEWTLAKVVPAEAWR